MTVPTTSQRTIAATISLAVSGILAQAASAAPVSEQVSDPKGVGHSVGPKTTITPFNLPPQSLAQSLRDIGAVTNTNILFDPPLVKGLTAPALKASLTTNEALTRLLAGTAIKYEFINDSTIVVGANDAKLIRLAQADTTSQNSSTTNSSAEASEDKTEIQEILVTATKRTERIQDVPISIVAVGADELRERHITGLDDLPFAVPGLAIQSSGGFQRRVMLRGVSNVFGSASLIGMYLDEAPATGGSPRDHLDVRTYDLERVEVLRGPQGTLYGEGSVGGTIRFITKNPELDQFDVNANVGAQFTEDGEPGQRIEGALNVPLIADELGLRIAGTYDRQGGWIDQPTAGREDINDQELAEVRIKGLWQPASQFTVNAMALIHRNDSSINTGEDDDGNFTHVFNQTLTPSVDDDYDLFNLTLTYDFPAARILNTTSYLEQDKVIRDYAMTFQFTEPGTPRFHWTVPIETTNSRVFTEELRLTSVGSGPWQWTIGGFYRDAQTEGLSGGRFGLPDSPGAPLPPVFIGQSRSLSDSWAVFADASYQVTHRLTLGTGLRYFEDHREAIDILPSAGTQTGKFDSVNPRLYARYALTDGINTYASVAKGFRSGGFNFRGAPPFDPESVVTYELGTKIFPQDGRMSADASVFYSNYKDYQTLGVVPVPNSIPLFITSNAGDATIKGIELQLGWHPTDQWALSFSGTYLDSELKTINATLTSHAVGDPLDLVPKYQYTVSTQRDFKWNGRPGFARLDYNEQGRSTFRNRSIGPWYFAESDILNMLNLNLSLQWSDALSLGVFAQNLLNDRGFTDAFSIEANGSRARPRTFGIEFGASFE